MTRLDPEKLRILRTLDVDAALAPFRKLGFPPASDERTGAPVSEREVVLAGLHKMRIRSGRVFTREEREASRLWLAEHDYDIPTEPS